MKKIYVIPAALAVMLSCPVSAADIGWQGETGNSQYIVEDGSYARGIVIIDGTAYRFKADGSPLGRYTGICTDSGGTKYYTDGELLRNEWMQTRTSKYYFGSDGYAVTGRKEIDGSFYSFDKKGRLITASDKSSFSIKADTDKIFIGDNDIITMTVSADMLSESVYVDNAVELHKMTDNGWVRLTASGSDPVYMAENVFGMMSDGVYTPSVTLSFTPDKFSSKLTEGHYRVAVPVVSGSGKVYLYSEFDAQPNAEVRTAKTEYDIRTTDKIELTVKLNSDSFVHPQVNELYIRKNGTWKLVEPADGKAVASEPKHLLAGSEHKAYLDLNRYDKGTLETGTYKAYIGDGISAEFMLTNPVDVTIEQAPVNDSRNVKVTVTLRSRKYDEITCKGYGG
ncbi:MAG: hypothetical protein J6M07_03590, partial [Ruminococcus sp.]|nr:hypothetical protein [Ruminococcus sp.]